MYVMGYLIQVAALIGCLGMAWVSRRALNGFARSLIAVLCVLIVHSLDDAFSLFGQAENFVLTSVVVAVITIDLYAVFKRRRLYAAWVQNRREAEERLENMRKASESRTRWDDETLRRWL